MRKQKKIENNSIVKYYEGTVIIFEIYLNNFNEPRTHIEMDKQKFTWNDADKEILLMPMFTFQVTKIMKNKSE